MNLNNKIIKTIGLFICITITVIILIPHEYRNGQPRPWIEYIMYLMTPGISFSLFVVIFFFNKNTLLKNIFIFIILCFLYGIIFFFGYESYGLMNIFTGGIGFLCINKLLPEKIAMKKFYIFLIGMAMGMIGLISFYHFTEPLVLFTSPLKFVINELCLMTLIAAVPWQVATGILLIFMPKIEQNNKLINLK